MRLRLKSKLPSLREYAKVRPRKRTLDMPSMLKGGKEVSYTYSKEEEARIIRDSFAMWLWVFDTVMIVTLITVAVIAITGGRT